MRAPSPLRGLLESASTMANAISDKETLVIATKRAVAASIVSAISTC